MGAPTYYVAVGNSDGPMLSKWDEAPDSHPTHALRAANSAAGNTDALPELPCSEVAADIAKQIGAAKGQGS